MAGIFRSLWLRLAVWTRSARSGFFLTRFFALGSDSDELGSAGRPAAMRAGVVVPIRNGPRGGWGVLAFNLGPRHRSRGERLRRCAHVYSSAPPLRRDLGMLPLAVQRTGRVRRSGRVGPTFARLETAECSSQPRTEDRGTERDS